MQKKALRLLAYERIVARYRQQGMSLGLANRRAFTVLGPWIGRRSHALRPPIGPRCLRCGSRERLLLDHVISQRKGGWDVPANFQTLCMPCNSAKGGADTDYREPAPISTLQTSAARRFS